MCSSPRGSRTTRHTRCNFVSTASYQKDLDMLRKASEHYERVQAQRESLQASSGTPSPSDHGKDNHRAEQSAAEVEDEGIRETLPNTS